MVTIAERDTLDRSPTHALALDAIEAGIEAAHPDTVVEQTVDVDDGTVTIDGSSDDLAGYDEVLVLGGGKAAGQVAHALEGLLDGAIDGGVVVTNDPVDCDVLDVVEASHPVPDERGVAGAQAVLERAGEADERTLILAVLTGGGSALLAAPAGDLTLADVRAVTRQLLRAGAPIDAINAVRKHCSAIKGGRLAAAAQPATVAGFLFSDVVGDDPSVIASGPTTPDHTTYADAIAVLDDYDIDAPAAVRDHLQSGADGEISETPGPGASAFASVENHILANSRTAIDAACNVIEAAGYESLVFSSRIRGEAREQALAHVAVAEECLASGNPIEPPAAIVSGGETTVTVTGDGEGGPNLEFALQRAIETIDGVCAAVDTDGSDGATDAAGAIVDGETVEDERTARRALDRNDALPYLSDRDVVIRTGATGTNVNDLRVFVLG